MGFFDLFKKKKTTEEPKPTTPIAASPEESVAPEVTTAPEPEVIAETTAESTTHEVSITESTAPEFVTTDTLETVVEATNDKVSTPAPAVEEDDDEIDIEQERKELAVGLERTKEGFFGKLKRAIAGRTTVDADVLDDLEEVLITSDVGYS